MKRDASDYGTSRPKITQEDFDGDFIVLTSAEVEEITVDDDEQESGKRKSLVMTFEETGDKVIWLNVGQVTALIERFGDDDEAWKGQKIPVEKHTATFRGKKFDKVRIMASEEWDQAFEEAGINVKGAKSSARTTVKATPKRRPAVATPKRPVGVRRRR